MAVRPSPLKPLRRKFRAVVTYRGTEFFGWQRQKAGKTVQAALENALREIFQTPAPVKASGRTDTGVHGTGQTVSFAAETRLTARQVLKAVNAKTGPAVKLKRVVVTGPLFHPRRDVKEKTYRYLIARFPSPFLHGLAWVIPKPLNLAAMKKAASYLTGKHDFSAFRAAGSAVKSSVREIRSLNIKRERFTLDPDIKLIVIEITATGFLYKMARTIAGTLVDAGTGKIRPEKIIEILESRDRKTASRTAPGCGLYLKKVYYA